MDTVLLPIEKARLRCKLNRAEVKLKVLELFGTICKNCGFSDPRALQLDHINGTSKKFHDNKRGGYSLYYAILLGKEPLKDYQCLCANCNWIKRYTHGENAKCKRSTL